MEKIKMSEKEIRTASVSLSKSNSRLDESQSPDQTLKNTLAAMELLKRNSTLDAKNSNRGDKK